VRDKERALNSLIVVFIEETETNTEKEDLGFTF
jgi:hypothetical protein